MLKGFLLIGSGGQLVCIAPSDCDVTGLKLPEKKATVLLFSNVGSLEVLDSLLYNVLIVKQ